MQMTPPKVFISYSHDSPEHKAWVLRLASDLRDAGIDASLDQWDLTAGQDVASFMHDGIAKADRVLLICTECYVRKSVGGHGGVGYERLIVTAEMVEAVETKKFIPIVRANPSSTKVPTHFGPRLYIDFSDDSVYASMREQLCREILGAPAQQKPPLGTNPFKAELPTTVEPIRTIDSTGTLQSGTSVLSGKWFQDQRVIAEKGLSKLEISGAMELRLALHSPIARSQIDLLTAVRTAKIDTFGWPIGLTLDNRDEYRPRPFVDGVRAEVSIEKDQITGGKSFDYWALAMNGDFYLLQNLFEDMRETGKIYFNTRIVRVTEALMFAGNLYSSLGVPPETKLSVRVTHEGLARRTLSSAGGRRSVWPRTCMEQICETEAVVAIGSIREQLVTDVKRLTAPMFMLFEFAEFADQIYDDIVRKFEKGQVV
jgi:hypothetical protein